MCYTVCNCTCTFFSFTLQQYVHVYLSTCTCVSFCLCVCVCVCFTCLTESCVAPAFNQEQHNGETKAALSPHNQIIEDCWSAKHHKVKRPLSPS